MRHDQVIVGDNENLYGTNSIGKKGFDTQQNRQLNTSFACNASDTNGWSGNNERLERDKKKTRRETEEKKNSRAAKTILCNILLLLSLLLCIGRDNSCYEYAMKFNNSSRLMLSFRIRHTFSYLVVLLIFLASDGDKYTVWMIIWAAVSFDSFVWALPIIKCKYIWRILPRSHFNE